MWICETDERGTPVEVLTSQRRRSVEEWPQSMCWVVLGIEGYIHVPYEMSFVVIYFVHGLP